MLLDGKMLVWLSTFSIEHNPSGYRYFWRDRVKLKHIPGLENTFPLGGCVYSCLVAVQIPKAVTADLKSEHLLPFGFAETSSRPKATTLGCIILPDHTKLHRLVIENNTHSNLWLLYTIHHLVTHLCDS